MASPGHGGGEGDRELLDRFRRGDAEAFEALYRRHRDWALRVAARFAGPGHREDALDTVQEAFLYVIRKAPDLELRSRLTSLLYPALKHGAEERRRKRARVASLEEDPEVLPGLPDDIREAFRGLPTVHQEVLGLRFADDLPLAEIAELLGVPVGTVKSRLHGALGALRRRCGGDPERLFDNP